LRWFSEDWEEVVWVCGEARAVLRADLVGEILWQVAAQTRVFRWFDEDWEEVVWVCMKNILSVAKSTSNFTLYRVKMNYVSQITLELYKPNRIL
jgi:hypothetical protein